MYSSPAFIGQHGLRAEIKNDPAPEELKINDATARDLGNGRSQVQLDLGCGARCADTLWLARVGTGVFRAVPAPGSNEKQKLTFAMPNTHLREERAVTVRGILRGESYHATKPLKLIRSKLAVSDVSLVAESDSERVYALQGRGFDKASLGTPGQGLALDRIDDNMATLRVPVKPRRTHVVLKFPDLDEPENVLVDLGASLPEPDSQTHMVPRGFTGKTVISGSKLNRVKAVEFDGKVLQSAAAADGANLEVMLTREVTADAGKRMLRLLLDGNEFMYEELTVEEPKK
jgi:hypothetical protein